jgi:hypothetical protein
MPRHGPTCHRPRPAHAARASQHRAPRCQLSAPHSPHPPTRPRARLGNGPAMLAASLLPHRLSIAPASGPSGSASAAPCFPGLVPGRRHTATRAPQAPRAPPSSLSPPPRPTACAAGRSNGLPHALAGLTSLVANPVFCADAAFLMFFSGLTDSTKKAGRLEAAPGRGRPCPANHKTTPCRAAPRRATLRAGVFAPRARGCLFSPPPPSQCMADTRLPLLRPCVPADTAGATRGPSAAAAAPPPPYRAAQPACCWQRPPRPVHPPPVLLCADSPRAPWAARR